MEGVHVPPVVMLGVNSDCNLKCTGCYSRNYRVKEDLSIEELENILSQSAALGVSLCVITGGEPNLVAGLIETLEKYESILFLYYTNAVSINDEWIRKIKKSGNIVPMVSIDGGSENTDKRRGSGIYDRIISAMKKMRTEGVFFGFSAMVTRTNFLEISSAGFLDNMIGLGSKFAYYIDYVPVSGPADMMMGADERKIFEERITVLKDIKKSIFTHLPNDEFTLGGRCMAGGYGFIHIKA